MDKISKIASVLFGRSNNKKDLSGLAVSFDELMAQRRNVHNLRVHSNLATSVRSGDVKSAFKGRGIEVEEIREYTFGDDVRDIDWRVTARKNTPYTKVYAEEKDREIYVVLDLSASMAFGTKNELKSVTASKIAALLGWMAQENNDRFGVLIFDGQRSWYFKPQQNRAQLLAVFNKIVAVGKDLLKEQPSTVGLEKTLQLLLKSLKSRASVFIISDFAEWGENCRKTLAALSKKAQTFCICVYDILEAQAPAPGEYMISENGENLVFDSRMKDFCTEYANFFANKRKSMKDFCQKRDSRWLEIRTDIPITRQIKII